MIDIPLRPVFVVLILVWCLTFIGATIIERGIGQKRAVHWNNLLSTFNILSVERYQVRYGISWILILVARSAFAAILILFACYVLVKALT